VYWLRDGRAVEWPNPARDVYPVYPPWTVAVRSSPDI